MNDREEQSLVVTVAKLEVAVENLGNVVMGLQATLEKRAPNLHAWVSSGIAVSVAIGALLGIWIKPVEKDVALLKQGLEELKLKQREDQSSMQQQLLRELSQLWARTTAEIRGNVNNAKP